jgi:hypothetical protein
VPTRSTLVYAALSFDKLSEALSVWLKSLGISKRARPFASGLCVHFTRVRAADNNSGKRLNVSEPIRSPGRPKRLMRTRLGPMLSSTLATLLNLI